MKRKEYGDYLQDILNSINDTDEFVKGMTFEDFLKDRKSAIPNLKSHIRFRISQYFRYVPYYEYTSWLKIF